MTMNGKTLYIGKHFDATAITRKMALILVGFVSAALFFSANLYGAVTLVADGSTDTYDLIDNAGFGNENPDCVHGSFGEHVTQTFDSELGEYVFVFHSHIDDDNDRCTNFDRVRMEIKGESGSPSEMQHTQGQTAYYRWKFRLASDFVGSSSFTHIFQIKAQGGSDSGAPLITITPRSSYIEVLHNGGSTGQSEGQLVSENLSPFLGTWVEAYVMYESSESGDFEISLTRISDGAILLEYSGSGLDMWRSGADRNRGKWGVYRKKDSTKQDEQVRFADFCISESSAGACPSDIGTLAEIDTGVTQAEDMSKTDYESNVFEGVTVARATLTSVGYVNGTFVGSSGTYDVTIRCYDEDDGQSTLTFKVDGATIDSRTLDSDDNSFKDWTISGVSIGNGDEIRIEGARESGEYARVDYIDISSAAASVGTGQTQAENMTLTLYATDNFQGVDCAEATSTSTGSVSGNFSGCTGVYDITVRYMDEDDGQSTYTVRVDGTAVDSWTANVDDLTWKTRTISGVLINNGDEVRIEGAQETGEHARIDYIDISSSGSLGTGQTEAEDMALTLYETDNFLGVDCARATSTSLGYISGDFSGCSGVYDIAIRYMDENDGQATFTLRVDGTAVDSWTADVDDHTWKTRTVSDIWIDSGVEIRVEGARSTGEHARIDYIDISSP